MNRRNFVVRSLVLLGLAPLLGLKLGENPHGITVMSLEDMPCCRTITRNGWTHHHVSMFHRHVEHVFDEIDVVIDLIPGSSFYSACEHCYTGPRLLVGDHVSTMGGRRLDVLTRHTSANVRIFDEEDQLVSHVLYLNLDKMRGFRIARIAGLRGWVHTGFKASRVVYIDPEPESGKEFAASDVHPNMEIVLGPGKPDATDIEWAKEKLRDPDIAAAVAKLRSRNV